MKRTIRKLIAVLLAIVFVMQLVPAQAVDDFEPTYEVPFDEMEPVNTRIVPQFEEDIVMEAIAVGVANAEAAANGTAFTYDPDTNYSALLTDTDFQEAYADYVFSLEIANLQDLCDILIEASYSEEDVEVFAERWIVAFDNKALSEIWMAVFQSGIDSAPAFQPLPGEPLIEGIDTIIQYTFDYYNSMLHGGFINNMRNVFAQELFELDYLEAMDQFYETNDWLAMTAILDAYWEISAYASEWVMASYLKNLAAMNGVFDEIGMLRNALGIGLFEGTMTLYDASFRYDPKKFYSEFYTGMTSEDEIAQEFLPLFLYSDLGYSEPIRELLMDEGYTALQADAFVRQMAEVFAYQSLPFLKEVMESDALDRLDLWEELLDCQDLTNDIADMVAIVDSFLWSIIADILYEYFIIGGNDDNITLQETLWVVAIYLHNFAAINQIGIASGTIPDVPFTVKNYDIKEETTVTAITIGIAEAQGIDVAAVEIDEADLDILLNAIMPLDLPDLGAILRGVLLRKDVIPDDILVFSLLGMILDAEADNINETILADTFRLLNTYSVDELLNEVDLAQAFIDVGLLSAPSGLEESDPEAVGMPTARVVGNFLRYFIESWDCIRKQAGDCFDSETLDYILAWVSALYIKNLAELNADESAYDLAKSNTPLSKAEMATYERPTCELIKESNISNIAEHFHLENSPIYNSINIGNYIENYYATDGDISESVDFTEVFRVPMDLLSILLIENESENPGEFSILRSAIGMASTVMSSASSCGGNSGGSSYSCTPAPTPPGTSVTLSFLEGMSDISTGKEIQLQVTISPYNNETVQWSSSKPSVVEFDQTVVGNTRIATFNSISDGTAIITATVLNSIGDAIATKQVVITVRYDEVRDYFNQWISDGNGGSRLKTSADYNHPLAAFSMRLANAAYNPLPLSPLAFFIPGSFQTNSEWLSTVLLQYGFRDIDQKNYSNPLSFNTAGHQIAHRKVTINSVSRDLVVVAIRGTTYFLEWLTNCLTVVSSNFLPLGFQAAANDVRCHLNHYLDYFQCWGLIDDNPIVLVTGHSLGGAVSNLLARDLQAINGWDADRVFAYTFATPTSVKQSVINNQEYYNIVNILNNCNNHMSGINFCDGLYTITNEIAGCCDVITHVPRVLTDCFIPDDSWSRYGQDACFNMDPYPETFYITFEAFFELFDLLGGVIAEEFDLSISEIGQFFDNIAKHHKMSTYHNWMTQLPTYLSMEGEDISWSDLTS
jgi:hypothetical protein